MMPSGKGLNTHYLFASCCKIDAIPEHKTEFIDPIIYQCDHNLMIAFYYQIFYATVICRFYNACNIFIIMRFACNCSVNHCIFTQISNQTQTVVSDCILSPQSHNNKIVVHLMHRHFAVFIDAYCRIHVPVGGKKIKKI